MGRLPSVVLAGVAVLALQSCERPPPRPQAQAPAQQQQSTSEVPARAVPDPEVSADPTPAAPEGSGPAAPRARQDGDPQDLDLLARRALVVPVLGVPPSALTDSYTQRRGARLHEAIDLVAPHGTPVVAVDDGHIAKLFTSRAGGLTIYHFDPERRLAYYYAHLQRYAEGIREGMQVRRGDVIGYVGSSGNADPAVPHLHFAMFRLPPSANWWEGEPLNPYPVLSRAMPAQAPAGR